MEKIGKYEIVEHIGHGALGSVEMCKATDGSIVAVKTLFPQFAYETEYVKRFKREAKIAQKLSHPNVVKIIDVGEDKSASHPQPYIAMEFVDGKSLADIMHDRGTVSADINKPAPGFQDEASSCKTFSPEETIRIIRQLAGVLQAAEDLGLLHRDIKPQNILLDSRGNSKVLDFGLAKDTNAMESALSMTGQCIGTPPYMSPEQHEGKREIDSRSDLYSLGCTAYYMLTGHPPFEGPTHSAFARQHCEKIPKAVVKKNKDCPLNLSQIIDRLLAKNPEDRHQNAAELIEDLNRAERGEAPLKLYKPKGGIHNPLVAWTCVAVLICIGGLFCWNYYRYSNAKTVIEKTITDAKQLVIKYDFDSAKDKLDNIIAEYAFWNPKAVEQAKLLRNKLIEQQEAWIKLKEQQERQTKANERVRTEIQRKRDLHNNIREAERLCKNESTCKRALDLISKTYKLCNTNAERSKVATMEKKIRETLAYVRPWAAVANFTLDNSVEVKLSGSAIAIKLEQALGHKYRLVTRSQVSKALKELKFQSSDLADKGKAKEFGKMVGAEYLVTGSVVQLGKEITVACQCFDIETGAIKQTAEVSAFSVDDFNYMIRDAANILGMDDDQKCMYIDEKFNHPKHLDAGRKAFENGKYEDAVQYFKQALIAKYSKEAESLLKVANTKAEEQRIINECKAKYELAMSRGNKLLREHNWNEAKISFNEALKIFGYEYDKAATKGVRTAQGKVEAFHKKQLKDKYDSLITAGNVALKKQNWTGAKAAYNEALKVESYEYAEEALEGVRNAKGGAELMQKRNAATIAFRAVMSSAKEALKKANISGYNNDTFKAFCEAGMRKLKRFKNSEYWRYIGKSSQREMNAMANELENLKISFNVKYRTSRAMAECEQVYQQTLEFYRAARLFNKKDPQAYEKCSKTVKTISKFMRNNNYRYITAGAKNRLRKLYEQAKSYLKTFWNSSSKCQRRTALRSNMKLVYVAPGSFMMGSPSNEKHRNSNEIQHRVMISQGYWIGKYEVTQNEYQEIMDNNPSRFKNGRNPVEQVSWYDAVEFCKRLTEREHRVGRLPFGYEYRLPTEAEWEYAARGGNKNRGKKYSGSNNIDRIAWHHENSGDSNCKYSCWKIANTLKMNKKLKMDTTLNNNNRPHKVGTKSCNELGIYDMSGNVWEWCLDHCDYFTRVITDTYRNGVIDPVCRKGTYRVIRGGSWFNFPRFCRVSLRRKLSPSFTFNFQGFRIAVARVQ